MAGLKRKSYGYEKAVLDPRHSDTGDPRRSRTTARVHQLRLRTEPPYLRERTWSRTVHRGLTSRAPSGEGKRTAQPQRLSRRGSTKPCSAYSPWDRWKHHGAGGQARGDALQPVMGRPSARLDPDLQPPGWREDG